MRARVMLVAGVACGQPAPEPVVPTPIAVQTEPVDTPVADRPAAHRFFTAALDALWNDHADGLGFPGEGIGLCSSRVLTCVLADGTSRQGAWVDAGEDRVGILFGDPGIRIAWQALTASVYADRGSVRSCTFDPAWLGGCARDCPVGPSGLPEDPIGAGACPPEALDPVLVTVPDAGTIEVRRWLPDLTGDGLRDGLAVGLVGTLAVVPSDGGPAILLSGASDLPWPGAQLAPLARAVLTGWTLGVVDLDVDGVPDLVGVGPDGLFGWRGPLSSASGEAEQWPVAGPNSAPIVHVGDIDPATPGVEVLRWEDGRLTRIDGVAAGSGGVVSSTLDAGVPCESRGCSDEFALPREVDGPDPFGDLPLSLPLGFLNVAPAFADIDGDGIGDMIEGLPAADLVVWRPGPWPFGAPRVLSMPLFDGDFRGSVLGITQVHLLRSDDGVVAWLSDRKTAWRVPLDAFGTAPDPAGLDAADTVVSAEGPCGPMRSWFAAASGSRDGAPDIPLVAVFGRTVFEPCGTEQWSSLVSCRWTLWSDAPHSGLDLPSELDAVSTLFVVPRGARGVLDVTSLPRFAREMPLVPYGMFEWLQSANVCVGGW